MIMSNLKYVAFLLIGLWLRTNLAAKTKGCNEKLCPGPLYYYEELGCSPMFDNATSCCPTRYNCSNWEDLPEDKCLVNGKVYSMGETLPQRVLSDPCYHCTCAFGRIVCSIPSCIGPRKIREDCTYRTSRIYCCEITEICPDSPVTCTVDGKPYKAGETFVPHAEPEKTCVCMKGYTGVNSEEFCVSKTPLWCENVIHNMGSILSRCAPIYGKNSSLQTDCNQNHWCSQDGDEIIKRQDNKLHGTTANSKKDTEHHCVFGSLTMRIGDKLKGSRFWFGEFSCVCEIPPVPTCRFL